VTARSELGFGNRHEGTGDPTFRPPPGLGNPHVQTIVARFRRAGRAGPVRRVRLDTDDGDILHLDVRDAAAAGEPPHRGVCLLLHGLEGGSASGYIVAAGEALARRGILPVALNFRSCGGEPNRTLGSYHSGRTDDIARAIEWMADTYPGLPRGAVGFSLGGNALLVHLGRAGAIAGIDGAVAVGVPYELAESARALESGLGRLYAAYFLRSLRAKVAEKATRFPGRVPARAIEARTLFEFDDAFTAPVHGFSGALDYYERCSAARFVSGVRTPTLLIQSADDPLVPSASVPLAEIRDNHCLELAMTTHGGHVGYLDRFPGRPRWLEQRVAGAIERRICER